MEFDRELESGLGLFGGVLVDELSRHGPHNDYSEEGASLTSSAYIEWLARQRNRSTFDVAQGFHHAPIKDPAKKSFCVCVVIGQKQRVTERSIRCSLPPIPPRARLFYTF